MTAGMPNLLQPVILFETPLEVFENVRAVALSVIGILCQVLPFMCMAQYFPATALPCGVLCKYDWLFRLLLILKAGDTRIIRWAVENDMVEVCCSSIAKGNELTKVVTTIFLFGFMFFTSILHLLACIHV